MYFAQRTSLLIPKYEIIRNATFKSATLEPPACPAMQVEEKAKNKF